MKSAQPIPKVSVLMLTCNHERFIAQAIQSALMQRTSFDFEIVIGEDCSTDQTREIVRDFQHRHPEKIRLLLPDQNLGMQRNYFQTLQACAGQYISVLDGDDFWISPDKLQKQVDYLEAHRDCVICFHNVWIVREDGMGASQRQCPDNQKEISTLEDLLVVNLIPTCATMFRNDQSHQVLEKHVAPRFLDWSRHLLAARRGNIGYINETMAVYRKHSTGAFSSLEPREVELCRLEMYESLVGRLGPRYEKALTNMIFHARHDLAVACALENDVGNAIRYARLCLRERPFSSHLARKIKLGLRIKAPRTFLIVRVFSRRAQSAGESVKMLVGKIKPKSRYIERKQQSSPHESGLRMGKQT